VTPQSTSFLLWADIAEEHEAGFNEWYNREHVPDRVLGIPGFIQARRYAAVEGAPRYAAHYEVKGPGVFQDEAYLAMRRTPDARSQHYIAFFRNVIRFVGRPIAEAGAVAGIVEAAWVRLAAFRAPAPNGGAGDWQSFSTAMVRRAGIVRVRVFAARPELQEGAVSGMRGTVRERLRGPDRLPDVLLMIEGTTASQLADAEADFDRAAARPGWSVLGSARMQQVLRVAPR